MSALLVGYKHINAIMNYLHAHHVIDDTVVLTRLGQLFTSANYHAINTLYRKSLVAPKYEAAFGDTPLTTMQFIKSMDFLEYQLCEIDDWENSHTHWIVTHLTHLACYRYARQCLPTLRLPYAELHRHIKSLSDYDTALLACNIATCVAVPALPQETARTQ